MLYYAKVVYTSIPQRKESDNIKNKLYMPPIYIQIRDVLVEKIMEGEFKSDDQLPSERELSEMYNISRMTSRNALTQLVDSGYAYRLKGKGTFVKYPKLERDFVKLSGFSQMLRSKGIKPSNKIVKSGIIEADKKIASLLETTIGTMVYEIARIRYGNNVALTLEYSYLPLDLFEDLLQYDFENDSLYKVIEENYNYKLKFSKQWIKMTTLTTKESKLLNVKEHTPAFLLESITYDMDEKIVECTLSLNIGERTTFYTELWPNNI